MKKMDATDINIMRILAEDENKTPEDMAKELNIGSATVRRRINALTEAKIIRRLFYIDSRKIGGNVPAVIAFNVALNRLDEIMKILSSMDENTWLAVCTGRYDLIGIF
ncbi:MAG: Lrp/AsnC family transcriptional regulator [Deltaproteobacteria bacterium]|nr:Lrp/AsnC family transcriptional regulator [Deltaproteobacteria bacterium]